MKYYDPKTEINEKNTETLICIYKKNPNMFQNWRNIRNVFNNKSIDF